MRFDCSQASPNLKFSAFWLVNYHACNVHVTGYYACRTMVIKFESHILVFEEGKTR